MKTGIMKHACMVGCVLVVLYVLCLLWRYTATDSDVMNFHLLSLKTAFPGFAGYDAGSMILGAVYSYVYGFLGSMLFHSLHKKCCKG